MKFRNFSFLFVIWVKNCCAVIALTVECSLTTNFSNTKQFLKIQNILLISISLTFLTMEQFWINIYHIAYIIYLSILHDFNTEFDLIRERTLKHFFRQNLARNLSPLLNQFFSFSSPPLSHSFHQSRHSPSSCCNGIFLVSYQASIPHPMPVIVIPCDSLCPVYHYTWRKVLVKDRKNAQITNYLKLPPMTIYVLCFIYVRWNRGACLFHET